MTLSAIEIILYVADQSRSRTFYAIVLDQPPILDVDGMTAFQLTPTVTLGLMPESGIAKILNQTMPHPATGNRIPRCELYLHTQDPETAFQRAIKAGAKPVSPLLNRDWGDVAAYVADPDGHVLAFATRQVSIPDRNS